MWLVKLIAYLVLTILATLVLIFLAGFGFSGLGVAGVLDASTIASLPLMGVGIPISVFLGVPGIITGIISLLVLLIVAISIILLWITSWRYINKNKKIGYGGSGFMKFASILIPGLGVPIFLEGRRWY